MKILRFFSWVGIALYAILLVVGLVRMAPFGVALALCGIALFWPRSKLRIFLFKSEKRPYVRRSIIAGWSIFLLGFTIAGDVISFTPEARREDAAEALAKKLAAEEKARNIEIAAKRAQHSDIMSKWESSRSSLPIGIQMKVERLLGETCEEEAKRLNTAQIFNKELQSLNPQYLARLVEEYSTKLKNCENSNLDRAVTNAGY